jgi:phospholipid/cholesterol/gamma-HCH transport system substrate-binding protein
MRRDSINYLAVGSIVLLALGLLLYTLFRLTGGVDENTPYLVFFPNITGLSEGTPVTYEGYKIGSIGRIEPIREEGRTRYQLTLLLRDGWPIPEDSIAHITSEGLLADTVITIREGRSDTLLESGDTLTGGITVDVFSAVNSMASTVNALLDNEFKALLKNLDTQVTAVGEQFGDQLPSLLDDVEHLLATLQAAADRLPHFLDSDTEQRFDRIMVNGVDLSDQLLRFSNGLAKTQAAADALVAESHGTVAENRGDLRRATLALRDTLEQLSMDTDGILQNLDSTSRNMNEFSRQIRQNPGLLLNSRPVQETGVNDAR